MNVMESKCEIQQLTLLNFLTHSVQYVKRPGAVLDGGAVVARLQLDDPTKVKMVSILDRVVNGSDLGQWNCLTSTGKSLELSNHDQG